MYTSPSACQQVHPVYPLYFAFTSSQHYRLARLPFSHQKSNSEQKHILRGRGIQLNTGTVPRSRIELKSFSFKSKVSYQPDHRGNEMSQIN